MRKWFCLAFLAFFLFVCPASAATVGNVADPSTLTKGFFSHERPYGLAASLDADFIHDRNYRDQVGDFELQAYGTRLGVIIREKVFLYSMLQMGKYKGVKAMAKYTLPDVTGRR
jgi:hypothetical protein